jgi:hypothetical protein
MKSLFLIITTSLLLGCTAVPVERHFPALPKSLTQECPDLLLVPKNTVKLSEVLIVVTTNYSQYHQCRLVVESFQQWYTTQKEIFETIK